MTIFTIFVRHYLVWTGLLTAYVGAVLGANYLITFFLTWFSFSWALLGFVVLFVALLSWISMRANYQIYRQPSNFPASSFTKEG